MRLINDMCQKTALFVCHTGQSWQCKALLLSICSFPPPFHYALLLESIYFSKHNGHFQKSHTQHAANQIITTKDQSLLMTNQSHLLNKHSTVKCAYSGHCVRQPPPYYSHLINLQVAKLHITCYIIIYHFKAATSLLQPLAYGWPLYTGSTVTLHA